LTEDKYPNQQQMAKCAESIGLTYNQVKTWFKDRRRKEKRQIEGLKKDRNSSIGGLTSTKVNVNQSRKTTLSLAQKKRRFVQMQVLFPKDYILRRVFRKDGPTLGMEFDSPSQRLTGHKKGEYFIYLVDYFHDKKSCKDFRKYKQDVLHSKYP
jgi:Homeodomain